MMVSIRVCSLAAALALGLAAPASAGWWPSSAAAASQAPAAEPATATPARRKPPATGTAVPEPADFALFAAGIVGLLLGRRGSRSRRD